LRAEAEFEQAARQAEQEALETQTDMDLSHDPEPTQPDEDTIRPTRPARPAANNIAAAVTATLAMESDPPRRDLLPDIEEINSTLRSGSAIAEENYEVEAPRKRGGFRRGFMLIVFLFLIAAAVYIFAPQIIAQAPQAETALNSYVEWVDGLRLWLDQKVQEIIAQSNAAEIEDVPDVAPAEVTTEAPARPAAPTDPAELAVPPEPTPEGQSTE